MPNIASHPTWLTDADEHSHDAQKLANMIKSQSSSKLKEYAVVDVRDDDFAVRSLPFDIVGG